MLKWLFGEKCLHCFHERHEDLRECCKCGLNQWREIVVNHEEGARREWRDSLGGPCDY